MLKTAKLKIMAILGACMAAVCSAADTAQLDSLGATLGQVTTKAETVMTAIGSLALAVVIGVIVVKLIKKGSRAG